MTGFIEISALFQCLEHNISEVCVYVCVCVFVCLYRQGGFPDSSVGKESACNARDQGSIPGLGRSPGEGKGYPLQYSGLQNSMDCIGCKDSDTTE